MLKKLLLICLNMMLFIVIAGCDDQELKEEDTTEFRKLDWLQGVWEGTQGDAQLYESWRSKNYRIMEGISYTTVNNNRVYSQDMRLEQSNNKILYIITSNTSGAGEIKLELESIDDNTAEFVNPGEGYPQKIIYVKGKNNRMNVSLLGNEGDDKDTELTYKKSH